MCKLPTPPTKPTPAQTKAANITNSQIISEGVSTDQAVLPGSGEQMVRVGLSYISSKDGSSTTLLLSEQSNSSKPLGTWTLPPISSTSYDEPDEQIYTDAGATSGGTILLGFDWAGMNNLDPATIPDTMQVSQKTNSNHPGIVVVSYCDGHEATLRTDVDKLTYMQLMAPNDRGAGDLKTPNIATSGGIYWYGGKTLAPPLDEGSL